MTVQLVTIRSSKKKGANSPMMRKRMDSLEMEFNDDLLGNPEHNEDGAINEP